MNHDYGIVRKYVLSKRLLPSFDRGTVGQHSVRRSSDLPVVACIISWTGHTCIWCSWDVSIGHSGPSAGEEYPVREISRQYVRRPGILSTSSDGVTSCNVQMWIMEPAVKKEMLCFVCTYRCRYMKHLYVKVCQKSYQHQPVLRQPARYGRNNLTWLSINFI